MYGVTPSNLTNIWEQIGGTIFHVTWRYLKFEIMLAKPYSVEQPPHCDLLRLSLSTGRFVHCRRAHLSCSDIFEIYPSNNFGISHKF